MMILIRSHFRSTRALTATASSNSCFCCAEIAKRHPPKPVALCCKITSRPLWVLLYAAILIVKLGVPLAAIQLIRRGNSLAGSFATAAALSVLIAITGWSHDLHPLPERVLVFDRRDDAVKCYQRGARCGVRDIGRRFHRAAISVHAHSDVQAQFAAKAQRRCCNTAWCCSSATTCRSVAFKDDDASQELYHSRLLLRVADGNGEQLILPLLEGHEYRPALGMAERTINAWLAGRRASAAPTRPLPLNQRLLAIAITAEPPKEQ